MEFARTLQHFHVIIMTIKITETEQYFNIRSFPFGSTIALGSGQGWYC
uniref:Uncharacterized protein n=1 Tax=Rhizophora mucronata TaxID=61149 RepID=A0A2P2QSI4_RHIMU